MHPLLKGRKASYSAYEATVIFQTGIALLVLPGTSLKIRPLV